MTWMPSTQEPLYSTLGEDPDLREIVELFLEEMPDRVSKLLDRLDASDWDGLHHVAHQLKGAAGSYGFQPVSCLAGEVLKAIRESKPEEEICQAVAAVVDLCNRLESAPPC